MGCLNCNGELKHTPGKRKKQFCSPDCRVRYWQKNKPKKDIQKPIPDLWPADMMEKINANKAQRDWLTKDVLKIYEWCEKRRWKAEELIERVEKLENAYYSLLEAENKPHTAPQNGFTPLPSTVEEKGQQGAENNAGDEMPPNLSPIQQAVWRNNQKLKNKKPLITQFGSTKKEKE